MPPRLAVLAVAAVLLSGCGDGRSDALETAERWFDAVADREPDRACELMARTAVDAIRARYTSLGPEAPCRLVIERYARELPRQKVDAIRRAGLELEGTIKNDQIGVFPVARAHELEVILMRRSGDTWKVVATRIAP